MTEYVFRLAGLLAGHLAVVAYSLAVLAGLALVSTVVVVFRRRRPSVFVPSGGPVFYAVSDVRTFDGDLQARRLYGPAGTPEDALGLVDGASWSTPVPPYCYLESTVLDLSAAMAGGRRG